MQDVQQLSTSHRMNKAITKKIIELQEQGFDLDFCLDQDKRLRCVQNNFWFAKEETAIRLVDLHYDQLTNKFIYIHSVETFSGYNGLILANSIFCNNNWA